MNHPLANPRSLEHAIDHSEPNFGYRADLCPSLGDLRTESGGDITGSTTPVRDTMAADTDYDVVKWAAADPTSVVATIQKTVEGEFAEGQKDLLLEVLASCYGSGTVGTTAIQAAVNWWTPGLAKHAYATPGVGVYASKTDGDSAETVLTIPASAQIGSAAVPAVAALSAFRWYTLDIGARLRAETKTLSPGDIMKVRIGLSATVPANLTVELAGYRWRFKRHAALLDRNQRNTK